jgi:hypothetical protein
MVVPATRFVCGANLNFYDPAEVAQSVEQWSEESRRPRFAELLRYLRLIPEFRDERRWSRRAIVLECGGPAHPTTPITPHAGRMTVAAAQPATGCLRCSP